MIDRFRAKPENVTVLFPAADTEPGPPERSLEAHNLTCVRDDEPLFERLAFRVDGGQMLLIEGRNGSGKTSLLRILCGLGLADSGEVRWCGQPIETLGADYHRYLAYVGHHDGIKRDLTVRENLDMARALGCPGCMTVPGVLQRVGLRGYEESPAQALSAGQRRRLALARLLVTASPLWILDEPFTAMDRQGIAVFEELMGSHVAAGGMVVLTSHHAVHCDGADIQTIRLSA